MQRSLESAVNSKTFTTECADASGVLREIFEHPARLRSYLVYRITSQSDGSRAWRTRTGAGHSLSGIQRLLVAQRLSRQDPCRGQ